MKVTAVTAKGNQTSVRLDLELDGVPAKARNEVKEKVGEFLVEQTLLAVGGSSSPVQGEEWPALSAAYKHWKEGQGGSNEPDLELSGGMLDALDFNPTSDGIEIGVYGKAAPRADGHNNLSGESDLPQRRFLPGEGQEYKSSIQKEIDAIIADAITSNVKLDKKDLDDVSTSAELYAVLEETFGDMARADIRDAVLNSSELIDLLDGEGLLDLL